MALTDNNDFKNNLAAKICLLVIWGTIVIAVICVGLIIFAATTFNDKFEVVKYLCTTLLPLWGTWIGTVLAYYFSKENFEAATKGINSIIKQVSARESLKSFSVENEMIPLSKITRFQRESGTNKIDETISVKEIFDFINKQNATGNIIGRVPFIKEDDTLLYIIHISTLEKFKLAKLDSKVSSSDIDKITLLQMKDEPIVKKYFENGAKFASKNTNLSDIQDIFEKYPGSCEDVFITEDGQSSGKIIGWITNDIVLSKLTK
ncbi:MAG: hypothetical protein K1X86_07455 [Ignavibacteria bacterium]|nr:hypothetical protein [Ignavibacteria bacterium]